MSTRNVQEQFFCWKRTSKQCDQMAKLFFSILDIYDNENLLLWQTVCHSRFKILPDIV